VLDWESVIEDEHEESSEVVWGEEPIAVGICRTRFRDLLAHAPIACPL